MKKAKVLALFLAAVLMIGAIAGCTGSDTSSVSSTDASSADSSADTVDVNYISVISKGFEHQFWQTVKEGADAAAADYDVEIYFNGPDSESDIAGQIDMINAELAKNPDAIALAALDTDSVLDQLQEAYDAGIPVIGFDSGVPDAPDGQIRATASTDNEVAAALGAEKMYPEIADALAAGTTDEPAVISVLSQDNTSASIIGRTTGFAEKMYDLAEADGLEVAIQGGISSINKGSDAPTVIIDVKISASTTVDDISTTATGLLNTENLVGVFNSNEGAVGGFLAALTAGASIPSGVVVVGFDAGSAQKEAIREGTFFGSITQDPYMIGYYAVELAYKAAKGETVADTDTGAQWYNADNIDDEDIAKLVYD